MTAPTTFDITRLIFEVLDSSAASDVRVLAKEVSERTPDEDLRQAYEQLLPVVVTQAITQARRGRAPLANGSRPDEAAPAAAPVPAQRSGDETSARQPGYSAKVARYQRYNDELGKLYATSMQAGSHKPLGEFSAADCHAAQLMNRALAAGNLAAAQQWALRESLLRKHNVERIGDLPASALAVMFPNGN